MVGSAAPPTLALNPQLPRGFGSHSPSPRRPPPLSTPDVSPPTSPPTSPSPSPVPSPPPPSPSPFTLAAAATLSTAGAALAIAFPRRRIHRPVPPVHAPPSYCPLPTAALSTAPSHPTPSWPPSPLLASAALSGRVTPPGRGKRPVSCIAKKRHAFSHLLISPESLSVPIGNKA